MAVATAARAARSQAAVSSGEWPRDAVLRDQPAGLIIGVCIYMLIDMRTTVVIEDGLLRQAKLRAAELDTTLSAVISQALRESLRQGKRAAPGPFEMPAHGDPKRRVRHEPADFARLLETEDAAGLRR